MKNIINLAKKYNFRLSAISNGSLFNEIDMKFIAQNFSSLGVSVDSINEYTNAAIGRIRANLSHVDDISYTLVPPK